jgi:tetratricopeptide (TPR) repeat protein
VKSWLIFLLTASMPAAAFAQTSSSDPTSRAPIEKGSVLPQVVCAKNPQQSYALYIPSSYSPTHSWPVVYFFDPAARGTLPLERAKEAAERHGFILAASNNSRNGPYKPQLEAADAMVVDTQLRLSIDLHRVYFAGFSGGARVTALLALQCKCAVGVLLSGAGFPIGISPSRENTFAIFSTVGNADFNYPELIALQDKLSQAGSPHWLRIFEGPHEWAPERVLEEALAWFRLNAMKTNREPRDDAFVQTHFLKSTAYAESLEKDGNVLAAWREYSQVVATYDSLADIGTLRTRADFLGKEKSVHDSLKKERNDFEEQQRQTANIESALAAERPAGPEAPDPASDVVEKTRQLRSLAEQEKHADRKIVLQRALSGVLVGSMETGFRFLEQKDYARAVRAFSCATQADPSSQWAWSNLAVGQALSGKRKETLNALRRARDLAKDKSAFAGWLNEESAFDQYRSSAEFQAFAKTE